MGNADQVNAGALSAVPLFPLPNVVLFPRAILPLHIFEERYRQMMADVLEGDGRIAMALLKPGWEKCYYARPAIEPVVCVGKILSHERLPGGEYNCLLQGQLRATIVREHIHKLYRVAQFHPLEQTPSVDLDLAEERTRLERLFAQRDLDPVPGIDQWRQLLATPLSTAEVADILAFNLIEDVSLKQSLLADRDVRRRTSRAVSALERLAPIMWAMARRRVSTPSLN